MLVTSARMTSMAWSVLNSKVLPQRALQDGAGVLLPFLSLIAGANPFPGTYIYIYTHTLGTTRFPEDLCS